MEGDGITPGWRRWFTPRTISFLVMAVAIGLTLFLDRGPVASDKQIAVMEKKQAAFMVGWMVHQVVLSRVVPEEQRAENAAALLEQIRALENQSGAFRGPEGEYQRYILLEYMDPGLAGAVPELNDSRRESELFRDFHVLYGAKRPLPDDSALFRAPAGKLALLKQYDLKGRTEEKEKLAKELRMGATRAAFKMMGLLALAGLVAMGGVFLAVMVYTRKPPRRFEPVLLEISFEHYRVLVETFILYLFLMYPFQRMLMDLDLYDRRALGLWPALAFILFAFGAALWYFGSNLGWAKLRRLLHDSGPTPVDGRPRPGIFREILWGLAGFSVVFPGALGVLVASGLIQQSGGGEMGVRVAHPVAFVIADQFWFVFVLAVIVAPITEEIMFRIFLFGWLRRYMRLGAAALATGIIFAVLHPQGYVAIPYLTLFGAGLCVIREFRPGIVAPIVAHMVVNGLAVTAAFYLLG